MTGDAWLTLGVVAIMLVAMIRDIVPPAMAVLSATIVLFLLGVIETQEALSGFSNPAPITVAVLYIVAGAVAKTGLIEPMVRGALGTGGEERNLVRLLAPVAAGSSVLNNTPIVALLAPEVSLWAERHGRAASRYLMPISFAAILGGLVTLIGTSTNLIVSGLLEARGQEPLEFFEITRVGLPIAALGVVVIAILAPRLLPDRRSVRRELQDEVRQFVIDMVVTPDGRLDGATVEAAGLRHLSGVFLAALERSGDLVAPVTPETRLRGGDRLRFAGKADDVVDLTTMNGLESAERDQVDELDLTRAGYFEAVVGGSSPLVGHTLKEIEFRSRYQAAVLAIHRAGQRVDAKLGEVQVRVGDTLVLMADAGFRDRWRDHRDFLLVSPLSSRSVPANPRRFTAAVIVLAMVTLAATGVATILEASLLAGLVVVATGILTPGEARNAVDLDVVLLMAGGFGLAAAMENSGLAETVAAGLVDVFGSWGEVGVVLGVALATVALTELVSNTAAALIVFPIALSTAASLQFDPRGLAITVAVAASASFLTPVGYQTNTMVYGPGGYRYLDYARLGLPLTIVVIAFLAFSVPIVWPMGA